MRRVLLKSWLLFWGIALGVPLLLWLAGAALSWWQDDPSAGGGAVFLMAMWVTLMATPWVQLSPLDDEQVFLSIALGALINSLIVVALRAAIYRWRNRHVDD